MPYDNAGYLEDTRRTQASGLCMNIFLPLIMFITVEAMFTFWGDNGMLVWSVVFVCAGISVLLMGIPVPPEKLQIRKFYLILGVLCFFSVLIATLFGWYNWERNMSREAAHSGQRTYNNVLPTEPALAHLDAGNIFFSPDSKLNLNLAVGYKDGSMYCVAPIMDSTRLSQTKGEYFAAGKDCCEVRAGYTCDDFSDPQAHSGMVYLKYDESASLEKFRLAAHEIAATHGITVSEDALFVKWVRDPDAAVEAYQDAGVSFFVGTSLVYAVLLVIGALMIQVQSRSKRP